MSTEEKAPTEAVEVASDSDDSEERTAPRPARQPVDSNIEEVVRIDPNTYEL